MRRTTQNDLSSNGPNPVKVKFTNGPLFCKSRSLFWRANLSTEANRKSQKLSLCAKMAGKHVDVPSHLNKTNLHFSPKTVTESRIFGVQNSTVWSNHSKWLKSNGPNSVKINLINIKKANCISSLSFHHVSKVLKDSFRNCRRSLLYPVAQKKANKND